MVRSAIDMVPGAEAGSVSVASDGESASHGATSKAAADLDAVQHALGEGPCLTALAAPPTARTVVVAQDLTGSDARQWPRFAPPAVELGYPAVLSLQLPTTPGTGASLNLYSQSSGSFEPADVIVADMFIGHLAHLMFGDAAAAELSLPNPEMGPETEEELRQLLGRQDDEP